MGALTVVREHRGHRDGRRGRPHPERRRPRRGTIEAEYVVIACGVWAPLLAEMAGAYIPLTPVVHQMVDSAPSRCFETVVARRSSTRSSATWTCSCTSARTASASRSARTPTARSSTTRRRSRRSRRRPSRRRSSPSPRRTSTRRWRTPSSSCPRSSATRRSAQKYAINGLIALTPDGMPLLGETPEVKGLWSAARGLGQGGPGGRQVHRRVDDPRRARDRLQPVATSAASTPTRRRASTRRPARSRRSPRPTASSTRPSSTCPTARCARRRCTSGTSSTTPSSSRSPAGSAPQWFNSNAPLVEKYGVQTRPNEWDARWWSPIINAEHLAMRESAGIFDLSAFAHLRHRRPGRPRVRPEGRDAPDGRRRWAASSTRRSCPRPAASRATSRSCGSRRTSSAWSPAAPTAWPTSSGSRTTSPADAALVDLTDGLHDDRRLGPATPARSSQSITRADMSDEAFKFGTCRTDRDRLASSSLASRISYVGDLGWELYVPMEQGRGSGTSSGRPAGRTASPPAAWASTAPPAASRRATAPTAPSWTTTTTWSRPTWPRAKVKAQDFVGKAAVLRGHGRGAGREAAAPSPWTTTRRRAASGATCSAASRSSRADGSRDHGRQGPPVLRDVRRRQPVHRQARAAGLPAAGARGGGQQALRPVLRRAVPGDRRASSGARPLFDPENLRIRA